MAFLMIYPAESDQSFSVPNPSVLDGSPFTPLIKEFKNSNCNFFFFFLQLHDISIQLRCEFISQFWLYFSHMHVYFSELRQKKNQNCEKSKCLYFIIKWQEWASIVFLCSTKTRKHKAPVETQALLEH